MKRNPISEHNKQVRKQQEAENGRRVIISIIAALVVFMFIAMLGFLLV